MINVNPLCVWGGQISTVDVVPQVSSILLFEQGFCLELGGLARLEG